MIYFAYATAGDIFNPAIHSREDMEVFTAQMVGEEGDAVELKLEVTNTRQPFPGRRIFFSEDGVLLFSGFITSIIGQVGQTITVQAVGKATNWQAAQDALCQTLKVAPHYDELSLPVASRNDISEVLSGHSKVLNWDRLTGAPSALDLFLADQAAVDVVPDEGSLSVSFEEPVAGVAVICEAKWTQIVVQGHDLAAQSAANAPGSIHGLETLTAERLVENFPRTGEELVGDVVVLESSLEEETNINGDPIREYHQVSVVKETGAFAIDPSVEEKDSDIERAFTSKMKAVLNVEHTFEVRRVERAAFDLLRPLQEDVQTGPVEVLEIPIQELKPGEADLRPDWQPATYYDEGAVVEFDGHTQYCRAAHWSGSTFSQIFWRTGMLAARYDIRRLQSFFISPRGRLFHEYMLERAKDRLRRSGRCVRVSGDAPIPANANSIHTGARVRILAPGLVGGAGAGKVVGYTMIWSEGRRDMTVEIACAPGTGAADTLDIQPASGAPVLTVASAGIEITIEHTADEQLEQFLEPREAKEKLPEGITYIAPPAFSTKKLPADDRTPGNIEPTKISFKTVVPKEDFDGTCDLSVLGTFGLPVGIQQ
jgi:hypothetical protein